MGLFEHKNKPFPAANMPGGLPPVPAALYPYLQFVVWRLEHVPGRPKPSKVPYNPKTGLPASSNDPATWGSFDQAALAFASGSYTGIGFVFTDSDPFVFLDFDDCRDDAGNWISAAGQWELFSGSAWEYSQSGNGLHVIVKVHDKAFLAAHETRWDRPDEGGNECYTWGRFVAFGRTVGRVTTARR